MASSMTSSTYLNSTVYPQRPTPMYPSSEEQTPPPKPGFGTGALSREKGLNLRKEKLERLLRHQDVGASQAGLVLQAPGADRPGLLPTCSVTRTGGSVSLGPSFSSS